MSLDPFAPANFGGVQFAPPEEFHLHESALSIREQWNLAARQPTSVYAGCFTCGGGDPYQVREVPVGPFVLPMPPATSALRMEVHTLRWGDAPWLAECAPSLADWCGRHGHPLKVWGREDAAGLPNEKFILVDLLRGFVSQQETERFLWVDADVWIHPLAPEFPAHSPGIHVMPDQPSGAIKSWAGWMIEHYGREPREGFRYRNAGIWSCDREGAAALLSQIDSHALAEGWMEQHQFNVWLHDIDEEISVHELPRAWNSFPGNGPAWFHHFAGRNKEKRIFKARQSGILPDPVTSPDDLPSLIDFGPGAVVWPYKAGAAQWDELWFSHRSVIEHWSEKSWPLVLLGDHCPAWWPGEFIHTPRYEDALWLGTQCAERVLWMNDDIFLLADQGPADLARAAVLEDMRDKLGKQIVARNSWRRGLGQVLMRLHHHGRPVRNFSTHTPYLYDRAKVREVFDRFGAFYKIPFETAYHNWHRTPTQPAADTKAKGPHDLASKLWINPAFSQATAAFREELGRRFGAPLSGGGAGK